MTRILTLAVLLGSPSCALAAEAASPAATRAAAPVAGPAVVNLALIEAIAAVELPQVTGLFSFIAEQDASFAFADLVARDPKSLKRYLGKLRGDKKLANGLTAWDHEVCATLVNLYSSSMGVTMSKPKARDMEFINECVLSPVVPLADIVSRRRR